MKGGGNFLTKFVRGEIRVAACPDCGENLVFFGPFRYLENSVTCPLCDSDAVQELWNEWCRESENKEEKT